MKRLLFAGIITVLACAPVGAQTTPQAVRAQFIIHDARAAAAAARSMGMSPNDNGAIGGVYPGPDWLPRKQYLKPQQLKHRIEDAPNIGTKTGDLTGLPGMGSTPQAVQAQVEAIKDARAVTCRRAAELVCRGALRDPINGDTTQATAPVKSN